MLLMFLMLRMSCRNHKRTAFSGICSAFVMDLFSGEFLFNGAEELELCSGADKVMVGVGGAVVSVAVEVVGQETHRLHVGESFGGVGEMLYLGFGEEGAGAFEVSFSEGAVYVHVEVHTAKVAFILVAGVCGLSLIHI